MNSKVKNLLIRSVSGLVLAGVFAGAILWSYLTFALLVTVIAFGCQTEFYRLCRKGGTSPQTILGILFSTVLAAPCLMIALTSYNLSAVLNIEAVLTPYQSTLVLLIPLLMLMVAMIFVCQLWRRTGTPVSDIGTTLAGVAYAMMPMLLLLFPRLLDTNVTTAGVWNGKVMLGYIFVIWANDVFAYLVGCTIGRHRLCERLSPKKSWEGFFGGIAGAVLTGWAVSVWVHGSVAMWCGLAALTAVTGVAGDLVESMFKRSADVKDSGNILPGHGGMLDRFDSLLISTPFAFVYLLLYYLAVSIPDIL